MQELWRCMHGFLSPGCVVPCGPLHEQQHSDMLLCPTRPGCCSAPASLPRQPALNCGCLTTHMRHLYHPHTSMHPSLCINTTADAWVHTCGVYRSCHAASDGCVQPLCTQVCAVRAAAQLAEAVPPPGCWRGTRCAHACRDQALACRCVPSVICALCGGHWAIGPRLLALARVESRRPSACFVLHTMYTAVQLQLVGRQLTSHQPPIPHPRSIHSHV
jgi:hypothetical protein